ncbi:MAG: hypothetical protein WCW16_05110 [Candidatus Magasanikbacteria bacterium]
MATEEEKRRGGGDHDARRQFVDFCRENGFPTIADLRMAWVEYYEKTCGMPMSPVPLGNLRSNQKLTGHREEEFFNVYIGNKWIAIQLVVFLSVDRNTKQPKIFFEPLQEP